MCTHVSLCGHTCLRVCISHGVDTFKARVGCQLSYWPLYLVYWDRISHLNLGPLDLSNLASHLALGGGSSCILCVGIAAGTYLSIGIWTLVSRLVWQMLWFSGHLPLPCYLHYFWNRDSYSSAQPWTPNAPATIFYARRVGMDPNTWSKVCV